MNCFNTSSVFTAELKSCQTNHDRSSLPSFIGVLCLLFKTLAQVFSWEFCDISKSTLVDRAPLVAASIMTKECKERIFMTRVAYLNILRVCIWKQIVKFAARTKVFKLFNKNIFNPFMTEAKNNFLLLVTTFIYQKQNVSRN